MTTYRFSFRRPAESGVFQGWYLAMVANHYPHGQVWVIYANGDSEHFPLKSSRWCLTRKGGRHYLPPTIIPLKYPLKKLPEQVSKTKFYHSISHAVKAFADDLTVLSKNLVDHHKALTEVESVCKNLDWNLNLTSVLPLATMVN